MKKYGFKVLAVLGALVPSLARADFLSDQTTAIGTLSTNTTAFLVAAAVIPLTFLGWRLYKRGARGI